MPAAAQNHQTFTGQANGDTANESFSTPDGAFYFVSVFRSAGLEAGGAATTFLEYGVFLNQSSFLVGIGYISNSAFQVQVAGQTAMLNLDTSTVAGFDNESCTIDPTTGFPTCTRIAGGVINLTWTEAPGLLYQLNGTLSQSFGGAVFTTNGTQSFTTAVANGTVLGATANSNNGEGTIGVSHNATFTATVP